MPRFLITQAGSLGFSQIIDRVGFLNAYLEIRSSKTQRWTRTDGEKILNRVDLELLLSSLLIKLGGPGVDWRTIQRSASGETKKLESHPYYRKVLDILIAELLEEIIPGARDGNVMGKYHGFSELLFKTEIDIYRNKMVAVASKKADVAFQKADVDSQDVMEAVEDYYRAINLTGLGDMAEAKIKAKDKAEAEAEARSKITFARMLKLLSDKDFLDVYGELSNKLKPDTKFVDMWGIHPVIVPQISDEKWQALYQSVSYQLEKTDVATKAWFLLRHLHQVMKIQRIIVEHKATMKVLTNGLSVANTQALFSPPDTRQFAFTSNINTLRVSMSRPVEHLATQCRELLEYISESLGLLTKFHPDAARPWKNLASDQIFHKRSWESVMYRQWRVAQGAAGLLEVTDAEIESCTRTLADIPSETRIEGLGRQRLKRYLGYMHEKPGDSQLSTIECLCELACGYATPLLIKAWEEYNHWLSEA